MKLIFPCLLIALSLGAGVFYLFSKDYGHSVYWFSAGVLNTSVTFWM